MNSVHSLLPQFNEIIYIFSELMIHVYVIVHKHGEWIDADCMFSAE